jgi:hypothetical protein
MGALSIYQRMPDPLAAIRFLGDAIAKSRLFKCENEAQGHVLAAECLARGMSPLTLQGRNHLAGGTLTKKAHVILADFQKYGGEFRLLERTHERASVELTLGPNKIVETLTWDEAQNEAWPWTTSKDGKKKLKDNWATPRARRQMLWARAISEGVRSICPQAAEGYAPEEFDQFADEPNENDADAVVDAAYEVKPSPAEPLTQDPVLAAVRDQHCERVEVLFRELGLSDDQQSAVLNKRGVSAVRQLSDNKLAELLKNLEAKRATIDGETSHVPESAMSISVAGPCTQVQIDAIKAALVQWNQYEPGVAAKFKTKMESIGKPKLADLTVREADAVQAAVDRKNMEAFFDHYGETPSKN